MIKTQIQKARDSGYSDAEIADFLSKKDETQAAQFQKAAESGYSPTEILGHLQEKEQPSRGRSLISAPLKGLIKGVQGLNAFSPPGLISREVGEKLLERFLPTQEKVPEQLLQKAGELAPLVAAGPEGLGAKVLQLAGGVAGSQLAKANEAGPLGETISEAIGMGFPGLLKGGGQAAAKAVRTQPEKLASGLTKPAAMEAKFASKAIISPERQEKAIKTLNEEASRLAKGTIERELPIAKKIEEGFDFPKHFETQFEKLKRQADKANPDIDITPISEFLHKSAKKYRGIPVLHEEGRKIVKEIRALQNRPQTEMRNLLKIFRSNNQKMKHIYETSHLTGKQQEYVDFLRDVNRDITKSFERTFPEDSAWVKRFKETNAEYAQYKSAISTLDRLEKVLGQKATAANLEKFASDKKMKQKLALSMGEKGAEEISVLAKDLKDAVKSLKDIPAKELKAWDTLAPLSIFVPHTHGIGGLVFLKKGADSARRIYGYFLATPARRMAYGKLLKAIVEKDKEAYVKAAKHLLQELQEEE